MELAVIVLFKPQIVRELISGLERIGLKHTTFVESAGTANTAAGVPFLRFGGLGAKGWSYNVIVFAFAPTHEHWERAAELAEQLTGGPESQGAITFSIPIGSVRGWPGASS